MSVAYTAGALRKFFRYRCQNGDTIRHVSVTDTAIAYGDPVSVVGAASTGDIAVNLMIAKPTSGESNIASDSDIYGFALADATASQTDKIPVLVVTEGTEVALRVWHATAASSQRQSVTANANFGLTYQTDADGAAFILADLEVTAGQLKLVDWEYDSATDDNYPVGWFKVRQSLRAEDTD